ncbi:MAG: 50S ribosomal protein L21 [Chloroflexota bacterium]
MYAIVESGGKQYTVEPGKTVDVDQLGLAEGEKIELDRVLLLADGDKVTVGNPLVVGAKVAATVAGERKGQKLIVYRYKAKVRYDKKTGHRQSYTRLAIDSIIPPQAK